MFKLVCEFQPTGDQPGAINALVNGLQEGKQNQILLGVTGSGKTFTMANVIETLQRPAIIMAHNKTLAAQLYSEMKQFFPHNAVEYFVSYYDYYQPEAYIAASDSYIEKDSRINEKIDLMRHSATRALFERKDVIIVASVSCIYGLGSPEWYQEMILKASVGQKIQRNALMQGLVDLQYTRNDFNFERGTFRVKGDTVDIFPSHLADQAWRVTFFGSMIEKIVQFDVITGEKVKTLDNVLIFANSHYITPGPTIEQAIKNIKRDLQERIEYFTTHNKLLEAQRIEQRTNFDLEMMLSTGTCKGIENYSRYLSGRNPGDPPPTLFEYLPSDAILFVDESHVSTTQVAGMYNGDRARKTNLVEHGFRLPSALDNRPLKFEEWDKMRPQTIFVSATPAQLELSYTNNECIEQIIRPTALLDPECIIRPATGQVEDLLVECKKIVECGHKILVTTLTKKMSEQLTEYLCEIGINAVYLHSDIQTLERIEIITDLRRGVFDVLVGVNLLREGLDIPECALVAILDADKEGFLRSKTSLIQTIGRAARNVEGKVILYADKMTAALTYAIEETNRRRKLQMEYNKAHGLTPKNTKRALEITIEGKDSNQNNSQNIEMQKHDVAALQKAMLKAAAELDFEEAAKLRDMIAMLENGNHTRK